MATIQHLIIAGIAFRYTELHDSLKADTRSTVRYSSLSLYTYSLGSYISFQYPYETDTISRGATQRRVSKLHRRRLQSTRHGNQHETSVPEWP